MALVLLAVAVGKILTTGLTIGSGGSGGVFGPSMVIGGCGGGALGIFLHWLWPAAGAAPGELRHRRHGGLFRRRRQDAVLDAGDRQRNDRQLQPAAADAVGLRVAFLLSDEQSIYSSQVESRSRSPAHQGDYVREVLTGLKVEQFLSPHQKVPVLHLGDSLETVMDLLDSTSYSALPVTNEEGQLLGVVSLEQVHLASRFPNLRSIILAADLMRTDVVPLHPSDPLDFALELLVENNLLELPVVDETPEKRVIGIVKRAEVSSTYLRHVHGMRDKPDGAAQA